MVNNQQLVKIINVKKWLRSARLKTENEVFMKLSSLVRRTG